MEWREYQDTLAGKGEHWSANRYRSLAKNVARHLPVEQGWCLDAGCGEGLISFALSVRRPGLRLCGTDISAIRLTRAASRVHSAAFVAGDLLKLPWRDGAFDAAVCCEVLEHLPDHLPAVEELFRVVKPGGVLLVSVPDRQKLKWSVCPKCGEKVHKDGHIRSFTPDDVRGMLEPWGEVTAVVSVGKVWRMIKRRLASLLPGKEFKGRYLLGVARKIAR